MSRDRKVRGNMVRGTRFIMILFVSLIMVFAMAGAVFADDSGVNAKPTLQELRNRYNALGTPPVGDATFATSANVSAYTPATLTNASLTFAQNYINFMRYQAGLGEITLDGTLNANAAQGALILARLNSGLTHYPATPSGVTDAAAKPGKYACATSNISYISASYSNISIIDSAILGQMKDEKPQSNIDCLGHRRWLLKPSTSTMGFGSAKNGNTAFSAVRVFNGQWNEHYDPSYGNVQSGNSTNYNFVAWPASGYMLNTVFDYRTPWSVQLNASKYNEPEKETVQVEVTRRSDNKKWTLNNGSSNTISDNYISSNYFNVNNQGYGEGYCIIFCPNPNDLGSGKLDDIFDVKVTGLSPRNTGVSSTIQYTVNFKGLTSVTPVSSQMITLSPTGFTYNGANQKPSVTVKDGTKTLIEGTDYTLTNNGGTGVGTYNVVVTGKGNYTGSVQKTFRITPKSVDIPAAKTGLVYNGSLQKGFDESSYYTIRNGEKTNAGTYTATLELKDKTNTTWSDGSTANKEVQWSIAPKSVTAGMITSTPTGFTYNGTNQKPSVTVKDGSITLTKDTDYTLTNEGGTSVGTYYVVVTGKGNYTDSAQKSYSITAKEITADMVELSQTEFIEDGTYHKPEVTVWDGATTLIEGTDYTLTNNGGTSVGTYNVVVTGKGNYTGTVTKSFSIAEQKQTIDIPSPKTNLVYNGGAQKGFDESPYYTITNGEQTNAGTYTATFELADKTGTTWDDGSTTNKEVQWSIAPKSVTADMITLSSTSFTYNGSNQKPSVTVKDGATTLIEGTDYTLTNAGGTNVGEYSVTIAGKGNYSGNTSATFEIAKASNEITKFIVTGGTEGSNPFTITLEAKFGKDTAVYTFSTSEDGDYTSTRPTKKGTYYAKVSIPESGNYFGAESGPLAFTIKDPSSNKKPTGSVTILNTIANSAKKTNDVIWDKSKVKGATNYVIQWRARGASNWASRTVGDVVRGTTSGLTIKGLYEIRVIPKNAAGVGTPSNTVYRYFHTTEKIRLASKSKGSFIMSWKKNPQATSYQVLYTTNKNGSGAAQNIKTAGANATSITVRDIKVNGKTQKLKSGTTYYVQIREMRKIGKITYIGNISCPVAVKVK